MEVPMVAARGPADARALGVEPRRMADVLAEQARRRGRQRRPGGALGWRRRRSLGRGCALLRARQERRTRNDCSRRPAISPASTCSTSAAAPERSSLAAAEARARRVPRSESTSPGCDARPRAPPRRRAGVQNVSFVRADAQVHSFEPESFELATQSASARCSSPIRGRRSPTGSALHAGGRLALISWRGLADNEWILNTRRALAAGRDLPPPSPRRAGNVRALRSGDDSSGGSPRRDSPGSRSSARPAGGPRR